MTMMGQMLQVMQGMSRQTTLQHTQMQQHTSPGHQVSQPYHQSQVQFQQASSQSLPSFQPYSSPAGQNIPQRTYTPLQPMSSQPEVTLPPAPPTTAYLQQLNGTHDEQASDDLNISYGNIFDKMSNN